MLDYMKSCYQKQFFISFLTTHLTYDFLSSLSSAIGLFPLPDMDYAPLQEMYATKLNKMQEKGLGQVTVNIEEAAFIDIQESS